MVRNMLDPPRTNNQSAGGEQTGNEDENVQRNEVVDERSVNDQDENDGRNVDDVERSDNRRVEKYSRKVILPKNFWRRVTKNDICNQIC